MVVNDNTVSSDFPSSDVLLRVYPNPTTGLVQLHAEEMMTNIEISDLQGRALLSFDVHERDFSFDISQLPDGVYFLMVMMGEHRRIEKIVRN